MARSLPKISAEIPRSNIFQVRSGVLHDDELEAFVHATVEHVNEVRGLARVNP